MATATKEAYIKEVEDDGAIEVTQAAIQEQLGLDEEDDWVAPLLISVAGCICTCGFCCILNWWLKRRRNSEHSKEMKA